MMMKKNTKEVCRRSAAFLAAAVMTAALMGGQASPVFAGSEGAAVEAAALIPENVTIEEPTALSNISLPQSEYGTLSWADGSYVPTARVESCEVVFQPSGAADLSHVSGWDGESGVISGYVTVVVSSISDEAQAEGPEDAEPAEDQETTVPPEATVTPEVTGGPEATVTPEATGSPETTVTPDVSAAPDTTGKPEEGEASGNQEDKKNPGEKDQPSGGDQTDDDSQSGKEPAGELAPADQVGAEDGAGQTPPPEHKPGELPDNIFDRGEEEVQDARPVTVEGDLTEEEISARGAENHSCSGISVSGISLPWYVQFRVSSGDGFQFTNESDAAIFQSFEFELWDLQNNTEYEISDGEYISVTVPVKEGYEYIIEHLLDSGAVETIVPSVDGGMMVFSTHSFSPFGIAGSKPLVGSDIAEDGYTDGDNLGTANTSPQQTTAPTVTPAALQSITAAADGSQGTGNTSVGNTDDRNSDDSTPQKVTSGKAVNTGDTTKIYPFVILVIAAAVIIGVAIFMKKRK